MISFLQQLTTDLVKTHGEDLSGVCLVFPTRRAGLFFRKELAAMVTKPSWAPVTHSIQDFFGSFSVYQQPDPLTLRFELYKIYKAYFPGESFDKFYPWGELMLRDFDDLDHYLADAGKVFALIHDIREIETDFNLPEEELERLKTFWMNFFQHDPSILKTEFINTWEHLGSIYQSFKESLAARGLAYEGMAYREIAERFTKSGVIPEPDYDHIVFAGFYALSPAEERIIHAFLKTGKATIYWDADSYYADDTGQEAGTFLRNHSLVEEDYKWKQDYFQNTRRQIDIVGVPLLVGQAKYAGTLVKDLLVNPDFKPERTVVVLPDENLLFPVLYSLPEELTDINVTMGYPLQYTPLFHLFESLIALQRNVQVTKAGKTSYYFRDVLNILNHPYIRLIEAEKIRQWVRGYEKNRRIRIPQEDLDSGNAEVFSLIFQKPEGVRGIFAWGRQLLRLILESMKEQEFRFHRLESEFVYNFYTQLNRLEEVVIAQEAEPGLETFWYLFREIIYSSKIPFTGEPLKGLQVMGFLETRVLDFDNVILLSVNEDVLPSSGNKPSFIPFSIRKAFGLPTYEEQHSVSAYHFYRLLQRASRIHLVYNTEAKASSSAEKSRFLLQIQHELAVRFPESITVREKVVTTGFSKETVQPVTVEKSPTVMEALNRYLWTGKGKLEFAKRISPSALANYISCPLKFYFRSVAGMYEKEETEENMEAATFGKVLHKAMQILYTGLKEIRPETLAQLRTKTEAALQQALSDEYVSAASLEGKNILLGNVIRELIAKILVADKEDAPFHLLALEMEVNEEFVIDPERKIILHGFIDRLDETPIGLRIIDYKTGNVEKKKPKAIANLFSDPKYKEQFQAMLYAYVISTKEQVKTIRSGLFTLKDMADGLWYLQDGEPFTQLQFLEFETELRNLMATIFNPAIPFTQTEDEKRCVYCPYKEICNR